MKSDMAVGSPEHTSTACAGPVQRVLGSHAAATRPAASHDTVTGEGHTDTPHK